jgi:phage-related minor tail protein
LAKTASANKRTSADKKMTTEQYVARLEAERAKVARHYCNVFKFWRSCPFKPCRKARLCSGDQNACLKKREQEVSRERQFRARQQVLASTPANAGPPERTAREFLPGGLCALPRGGGRDGCG